MKLEILFDLTPITLRYLRELVSYANKFFGEQSEQLYKMETYLQNEWPDMDSERNRNDFWKYLEDIGAVKVSYPKNIKITEYADIEQVILFPLYYSIQLLKTEPIRELLKIAEKQINEKYSKGKVDWDEKTSTLTYKNARHKFQEGEKKDTPKLKIFKILWRERNYEKIHKKGMPLNIKALASQSEIAADKKGDSFTQSAEKKVLQLAKDISTTLKKKKFPISIKRENNTLLMMVSE